MTTNQTIDGVPGLRSLLERAASRLWADGNYNMSKELRTLLDAPVNPISEIEVLRAAVKELEAMRDARVDAKLAQGEPVAVFDIDHTGYRCKVVLDPSKPFPPSGTKLYAEQPAPVAVVMPERMPVPRGDLQPFERAEAIKWNACLDEVTRLNPSL